MKKVASLVGAGAMLLGMALPTFAGCIPGFPGCYPTPKPEPTTLSVVNFGSVVNDLKAKVNTGFNMVTGGLFTKSFLMTGPATGVQDVVNKVNTNTVGCDCADDLKIMNTGFVVNDLKAKVNSGFNTVMGGTAFTGEGMYVGTVSNVVNTNVIGD